MLLLSCPVQWCGSCPTHPTAVLASTAVVSCIVRCQVWCAGGGCVSVVFVWWGILCPLPPRCGGGWGYRGQWGAVVVVGGMVREGRLCCRSPRLRVGVPPCRLPCGPIEWRGVVVVCCPRVRIGYSPSHCLVPLALLLLSSPLLLSTVCVPCLSIVDLVPCLCDRVVSLWNSGDGLCWVEGRVVSTVRCLLFMCCGVCFSVVCVLSCCAVLWNGGGCGCV